MLVARKLWASFIDTDMETIEQLAEKIRELTERLDKIEQLLIKLIGRLEDGYYK